MATRAYFNRFCCLFAGVVLAVQVAARDELRFPNGDRISGKVVAQDDGVIRFVSETLGELEVPAEGVEVVLNVPDTPVEALVGLPPGSPEPVELPVTPVEESAQVRPPPPPAVEPAALAEDAFRWKGRIEAGFVQHSGRSNRVDLSLRSEVEKQINPKNSVRGEARMFYTETAGITTNDRLDGLFRWRHNLTDRMFTQVQSSAYQDDVKLIDFNAEQNAGLGYKAINRENHVLNVGAGLTAQYRESQVAPDGWAYLVEVFQDYTWRLNGRLTVTQNASAFYSPPELGNRNIASTVAGQETVGHYRLRFNSTLQGMVTERISMNLRYEFEHDATIVNPDLRDDQRITSSIGFAF